MADIVVKNVWKKYGEVAAVKGLSFDVKDGEILAILGPSGAGKTSTLKVIAGILPIDAGEIFIDGRLVNAVPTKQRDVAMIFETYALYPHLTVYENMAFPLRAPGRIHVHIRHRAARALGGRPAPHPRVAGAQAARVEQRPEAARLGGPRSGPQARRLPDGRADLSPRRQAAPFHARRAEEDHGRDACTPRRST